ncbi:MAG: hypothetical protein ACI4J7_04565 [Ruminiclostridium sp.]
MYEVSGNYLAALKEKAVKDSISGTITLTDGTVIEIDDSIIVQNTLKITKELCSDSYRIGTFNLSCLKLTIYDDNALGRDYSGAKISLSYKLFLGQDFSASEAVPLGIFTVEGQSVVRRKNRVTLTAYDNGIFFDVEPSESIRSSSYSAAALVTELCSYCGVDFGGIAEGLPNSSVVATPSDGQLQSCRDIIMWAAALMCGYAVIGRDGKLYIISAKYRVSDENSSDITIDRYITESERSSIYSTDTRAYIKYISAYCEGEVKEYVSDYTSEDEQAAPAVYALAKNPLISDKSGSECDTINESWLSYIDAFKQRGVNARIFGDPAIDLGDTIRFSGGDVDQRRSIVGVVTAIEWKYRNYQDIICTAAQCGESLSGASDSCSPCAAKSQTEKRIDGIKAGGVGKNVGNDSEIFNRYDGSSANVIDGAYAAHAEGSKNTIGSDSFASHAEGVENRILSSRGAHAEGYYTSVSNSDYSHVEGESSHIIGAKWAHAGGYGCKVFQDGGFAHGLNTKVNGAAATAFGSSTFAAGENQFVAGKGNIEDSEDKYALIIGNGTGVRGLSDFEASNALTLDWDGNLWVAGEIKYGNNTVKNYTAGKGISISEDGTISTEAKEYIEGEGIKIADNIISLQTASSTSLGGIKVGKGLKIGDDGTLETDGGGSDYTAGDGIEITEDNEINVTQATETAIGGIILGEGLEYDSATGKTNTVPNIQQAVIITEADAKYLLHEYTQIEYIAGNRIGYAGPGNQIVLQGFITNFGNNSTEAASGIRYAGGKITTFSGTTVTENEISFEIYSATPTATTYRVLVNGSITGSYQTCNPEIMCFVIQWEKISGASSTAAPYGYVTGSVYALFQTASGTISASAISALSRINMPFNSEAEYNAAVGLTYEPYTLTNVEETITQV